MRHERRAGFTLIEVLIAVLILAIGLLALGAVVPVVVRQQRNAQDAIVSVDMARGAADTLRTRVDLNRLTLPGTNTPAGFGVWLKDATWSPSTGTPKERHLWMPLSENEFDPIDGDYSFDVVGNSSEDSEIQVADRLWPTPASGRTPQFVWDFIGRRAEKSPSESAEKLQLAIFLRRLDLNIRPKAGYSLLQTLTNKYLGTLQPLAQADMRRPVGMYPKNVASPVGGTPTLNGTGQYARVVSLGVEFSEKKRDVLVLKGTSPGGSNQPSQPPPQNAIKLAQQIGQKLVDNFGNVYTVTEARPEGLNTAVRVTPAVPAWVPAQDQPKKPSDERTLRQVVFTPQVPASVEVVTLTIENP